MTAARDTSTQKWHERRLHKYGHGGQALVVDEIRATLDSPSPDYSRLAGIDLWGGSGAVWEVHLVPSTTLTDARTDKRTFCQIIIRIADHLDRLGIGTERCRLIAKVFTELCGSDQESEQA